jgi:hypothetical protein
MSTTNVPTPVEQQEPASAEFYISRSSQSIQTSRELIDNSRVLRLASIARYRARRATAKLATAKPASGSPAA